MESLRKAVEHSEYIVKCAQEQPSRLLKKTLTSAVKSKSLHQKLLDLYLEEFDKQPEEREFLYASHLLPKLVKRDKLSCLILNLYPANEGYSLMLKSKAGIETETIKLPYEESELLEYVDAAELPPFLVTLLEKAQVNVFHNGCVIVEVRDYRRSMIGQYDSQFVLLKPTSQSLLCDINAMISDGHRWTQEDIFQLESQLLLATEEPLCLDPSVSVSLVANKLHYARKKFNTPLLKRSVKKYTQAAVNRKRKFAHGPAPRELKLYDFLHRKKDRSKSSTALSLKLGKSSVDMWKQKSVQLSSPESVEVDKFAKAIEKPKYAVKDVNNPKICEEHTMERMERDTSPDRKMLAKLTIYQREMDEFYLGELYLDQDFKDGETKGCSCRFPLGGRRNVDKYLEQFRELFTEEGRRQVKITVQKPGEAPKVSFTHATQAFTSSTPGGLTITNAQALLKQASGLAATLTTQGSDQSKKSSVPVQLSLSFTPSSAASTITTSIQTQQQTAQPLQTSANSSGHPRQLSLNIQQANAAQISSHRSRHQQIASGSPSPVSTPTTSAAQIPGFTPILTSGNLNSSQNIPTPSATPPPNSRTPTPTSSFLGPRKTSLMDQNFSTVNLSDISGLSNSSSSSFGESISNPPVTTTVGNLTANINITNLAGIPPNINIQNLTGLPGINIANLQGLPNMHVSLTGVTVPGGSIAVPVPLSNTPVVQNQGGISVSALGNAASISSSVSSASIITSLSQHPSVTSLISSQPTLTVTSISTSTIPTSVISSSASTSGVLTNPTSVIQPPASSMLSLPIGIAGSLTQLMPANLKTDSSSTIRNTTPVPLLQLPGQHSMLLNIQQQQQRTQIKPSIAGATQHPSATQSQAHSGSIPTTQSTLNIPITAAMIKQNIHGQQVATLAQIPIGKQGQTTTTALTAQQLMQIAGQQATALTQQQLQQLQKQQAQQMQFHTLQPSRSSGHTSHSKTKSKKRTTPTPQNIDLSCHSLFFPVNRVSDLSSSIGVI